MNMRRIKAIVLALRIEYHWWHIKRSRKRFDVLYAADVPLVSPQVQKLNTQISKYAVRVMVCEKKYRDQYSTSFGGNKFNALMFSVDVLKKLLYFCEMRCIVYEQINTGELVLAG